MAKFVPSEIADSVQHMQVQPMYDAASVSLCSRHSIAVSLLSPSDKLFVLKKLHLYSVGSAICVKS